MIKDDVLRLLAEKGRFSRFELLRWWVKRLMFGIRG